MKFKLYLLFIFLCSVSMFAGYIGTNTMNIDQNATDWTNITGAHPTLSRNIAIVSDAQFIWQDAYGDDTGDGNYQYPTNTTSYNLNAADIDQFRVAWDSTYVYIYLRTWNSNPTWDSSAEIISISTNLNTGNTVLLEGDGTTASNGSATELRSTKIKSDFVIFLGTTYKGWLWNNVSGIKIGDTDNSGDDGTLNNFSLKDIHWNEYEVRIPIALIGSPENKTWNFIVGWGFENGNMMKEVQPENGGFAMNTDPTGGDNTWWNNTSVDPDVMDLIGASSNQQIADLSSYNVNGLPGNTSDFVDIQNSYVTIADYNRFSITPLSITTYKGQIVPVSVMGANTVSTGQFLNKHYTVTVYSNVGSFSNNTFYATTNTNIATNFTTGFVVFSMSGVSSYTLNIIVSNSTPALIAPTFISATAISTNQINLLWHDLSNETSYTLFRSTSSSTNSAIKIMGLGMNVTNYSDTGLNSGTKYYYWLKAYNATEKSKFSVSVSNITVSDSIIQPPAEYSVSFSKTFLEPLDPKLDIIIDSPKNQNITISIYNLNGELVYETTKTLIASQNIINWYKKNSANQILGSGLYLLRIKSEQTTVTQKIFIVN